MVAEGWESRAPPVAAASVRRRTAERPRRTCPRHQAVGPPSSHACPEGDDSLRLEAGFCKGRRPSESRRSKMRRREPGGRNMRPSGSHTPTKQHTDVAHGVRVAGIRPTTTAVDQVQPVLHELAPDERGSRAVSPGRRRARPGPSRRQPRLAGTSVDAVDAVCRAASVASTATRSSGTHSAAAFSGCRARSLRSSFSGGSAARSRRTARSRTHTRPRTGSGRRRPSGPPPRCGGRDRRC